MEDMQFAWRGDWTAPGYEFKVCMVVYLYVSALWWTDDLSMKAKLKQQFFRGWKKLFFKEIHQFLLHENSIIEVAAAVWEIDDSNH